MKSNIAGKVVVITGASSGLGEATARLLATEGASVALGARREKHWHGAAPATAMTPIAIQERLDGQAVDWLEKVSDEQDRK